MRSVGKIRLFALLALILGLSGVALAVAIDHLGLTPRALAPYIERRASGHNPFIVGMGDMIGRSLRSLDDRPGGNLPGVELPVLKLGAQAQPAGRLPARSIDVFDVEGLIAAIRKAEPGDVITLAPGVYDVVRGRGWRIDARRPGHVDAPIVVRAAQPGTVDLRIGLLVGIRVSAPWWRFENLTISGACVPKEGCEHAFHVFGGALGFAAVNNTISDFNAHFKINGHRGEFPDNGLIESNTIFNTSVRKTSAPVTPIDLVSASGWTIRANVIKDFVKRGGNWVSYGAFAKGAGSGNVFERNLVWCEHKLKGQPGQRIGLSLGGGGTGPMFCRDGKCITEQQQSVLRSNLIMGCSDVGIYINSASGSRIEDNTLIDTSGIDVRFPTSSADVDGNLVDGMIRSRNGGILRLGDNRSTAGWQAFLGHQPVRDLFADPGSGAFSWRGAPPRRAVVPQSRPEVLDLCTKARVGKVMAYGAFDDFQACLAPR